MDNPNLEPILTCFKIRLPNEYDKDEAGIPSIFTNVSEIIDVELPMM